MLTVPKTYSAGYEIDDDWIAEFEEQTELVENTYEDILSQDPNNLVNLLEKYFSGEHASLKMMINQPAIFALFYGYIKTKNFEKAELFYSTIFQNPKIDFQAICVNVFITFQQGKNDELFAFSQRFENAEMRTLKGHYFLTLYYLANEDIQTFTEYVIEMAEMFGVNEETKPLFLKLKELARRGKVFGPVRKTIKERRNEKNTQVLNDLYDIM